MANKRQSRLIGVKTKQPQQPETKLSPKQKINQFLQAIQQKIFVELDTQKSKVSNYKKPYLSKQDQAKKDEIKLNKLLTQKQKTQQKLQQLADKQFELQYKHRTNVKTQRVAFISNKLGYKIGQHQNIINEEQNQFQASKNYLKQSRQRSTSSLRPKSELTKQDISILNKLKKQHYLFEENLNKKTKAHQQFLQNIKKEQEQIKKSHLIQISQKRKKQLEEQHKQLQKRRQERIKRFQQEKLKLYEIKNKKKLFIQMTKKWQEKQKTFQENKIQKMKQKLQQKKINFSTLQDHQKQYIQRISSHKQESKQKFIQQSRLLQNSSVNFQKSKFYKEIIKQEKNKIKEFKKKQRSPVQKIQKMKQYSNIVKQEHAPPLKTKQDEDIKSQNEQQDKRLSFQQTKIVGNNYLKQAIQQIRLKAKLIKPLKDQQSESTKTSKSDHLSKRYKNYLQENKSKHMTSRSKYMGSVSEIKKIMNEKNRSTNSQLRSIQKIRQITQKLQHQPNDKDILQKIQAKIKILETIT